MQHPWKPQVTMSVALSIVLAAVHTLLGADSFRSHPPIRPLPKASSRPLADGPAFFVDTNQGNDDNDGSKSLPWKTIAHSAGKLKPGDTLYLRGGTFYEPVQVTLTGEAQRPITLRSFPGELVVIDAGHREFFEHPAEAWEPVDGGAEHEFRSTKAYPRGGGFGNFGDSMIPFQRYLTFHDLRSTNDLWNSGLSNRADDPTGIYAGPGVRRDGETGRIHVRLAHTRLAGLGESHYRGETDPRKLPLVIAGEADGLRLTRCRHVRIQDVVVRGAQRSAINVEDSQDIEFAGLTLYGSGSALRTSNVSGFRLVDSALRGHAAPWHSRGHHKDRAGAGYLMIADGRDFEVAYCELTDHHDGVLLQNVDDIRFHHNIVDHFNDDGVEIGPKKKSGKTLIYQNHIRRCLLSFSLHGNPRPVESDPGSGVYIFRNVVDLRAGVYTSPPSEPDPSGAFLHRIGVVCSDHGSPTWPVLYVYHNTFIAPDNAWRNYYGFGWAGHMQGTTRRVFNNIFLQVNGLPGLNFPSIEDDFHADRNLLWSLRDGATVEDDFFAPWRTSAKFQASKNRYPPGFGASDIFADPKLVHIDAKATAVPDVRLDELSPAINQGLDLPTGWPDVLRDRDELKPDIGALPFGVGIDQIGPGRGRREGNSSTR